MTAETILDEVQNRLGPLTDQAKRAVTETLEIIQQKKSHRPRQPLMTFLKAKISVCKSI